MGDIEKLFKMKASLCLLAVGLAEKDGTFVQDDSASRFICGGDITDDGVIISPGLDDPTRGFYYNNLNCTWEIDIPDATSITIIPEVFEIEFSSMGNETAGESPECNYDTLFIDWENDSQESYEYQFCSTNGYLPDGEYTTEEPDQTTTYYYPYYTTSYYYGSSSGRKRRAGLKKPSARFADFLGAEFNYTGDFSYPLQIQGGKATLFFQTDYSVVKKGFQLRVESERSCEEVQNGSGTITSPGYPDAYGHNKECVYTLNADAGKIIKITFNDFEVEPTRQCLYDSLSIMGRKHCGHEELSTVEGNSPPENVILVHAESTNIFWSTDQSVSGRGFSFSWESVDNTIEVPSGPLDSAAGFHAYMEMFLAQLEYQMEIIRPKRLKFLHRAWDHVQIDEAYYQSEGDCNNGATNFAGFPFKEFDESATICDNLENFASNAQQFFDNFVCMDNHEKPNITMAKWQRKAAKIQRISQKIRAHPMSEWSLCSEDPFHPDAP